MKLLFIPICFIFSICNLFSQSTVVDSFIYDGIYRSYRLYIPQNYTTGTDVPLVLNLHGRGSNAFEQELYGNFIPQANADNFIIAHPNSTVYNGGTLWNSSFAVPGDPNYVDDAGFLNALLDTITAQYSIDTSKVFSAGMSNGGFMSYTLACELGNRIKKVASVTGSMSNLLYTNCTPNRTVPILQIHGTTDPVVDYNGSSSFVGIDEVIEFWVNNNNCDTIPEIFNVPDINTTDSSTAIRYSYSNGTDNNLVVFYKVINGGHTWPDALINLPTGNTNKDFNASAVIWDFFKGDDQLITVRDLPLHHDLKFQKTKTALSVVSSEYTIKSLEIFSVLGSQLSHHDGSTISIADLNSGMYILFVHTDKGVYSQSFVK